MTDQQVTSGASVLVGASMTETELSKALGCPVSTVKRLRAEGKIPYVRIGRGRTIYLASSILEWLKTKETTEPAVKMSKRLVKPIINGSGLTE